MAIELVKAETQQVKYASTNETIKVISNPYLSLYPHLYPHRNPVTCQVKRRAAYLELELTGQKSNVEDLNLTLKQQRAERIVAQHETKKI
jgi:hypothetical protein